MKKILGVLVIVLGLVAGREAAADYQDYTIVSLGGARNGIGTVITTLAAIKAGVPRIVLYSSDAQGKVDTLTSDSTGKVVAGKTSFGDSLIVVVIVADASGQYTEQVEVDGIVVASTPTNFFQGSEMFNPGGTGGCEPGVKCPAP